MRTKIYKALGCSFFSIILAGSMFAAPAYASEDIKLSETEFDKVEATFKKEAPKKELSPEVTVHIPRADWLPNYYAQKEAERIAAEEAAKRAAQQAKRSASVNYNGGGNWDYPSGGGVLTYSNGRNRFNGHIETWYSTREPGQTVTAKPIPGRHTGSDGIIRDGDGYICVATNQSDAKFGAVVETSHGPGKVYDTGCNKGVVDIYTEW